MHEDQGFHTNFGILDVLLVLLECWEEEVGLRGGVRMTSSQVINTSIHFTIHYTQICTSLYNLIIQ